MYTLPIPMSVQYTLNQWRNKGWPGRVGPALRGRQNGRKEIDKRKKTSTWPHRLRNNAHTIESPAFLCWFQRKFILKYSRALSAS